MRRISAHIRLSEDIHNALATEADRLGLSINATITIALSQWLAQKEN